MRYSRISDVTSLKSCSCSSPCGATCVAMVTTPAQLVSLQTKGLRGVGRERVKIQLAQKSIMVNRIILSVYPGATLWRGDLSM